MKDLAQQNQQPPQRQLRNMLMGAVLTQALQTAAELGVADVLVRGAMNSATLAAELGVEPHALLRLLRTLAAYGVFEQREDGCYANSPMSDCLRADHAQSLRGLALAYGDNAIWRAWQGLPQALRSRGSAFEHTHHQPLFEYLCKQPETARRFDAAMASSASLVNDALARAYDWCRHRTIVDVGGGSGTTLLSILATAPESSGISFDLPHAAHKAAQAIARSEAADRCAAIAGDFFMAIPQGGDAYLLKHILHDWDDATCVRLLRRCHAAMRHDATLLVCERLLGNGTGERYGNLTDLVMLALTPSGRERTGQEYLALLETAGFASQCIIPVDDELSLLQARKR